MNNGDKSILVATGMVMENLPNTMFRVKIDDNAPEELAGKVLLCHLAGKMRMRYVKLLPGDWVRLEVNKLDLTRGRIASKHRN